jgi:predicted DNA repair protein MutK
VGWTEGNIVAIVLGLVAIIGGIAMFRHRVTLRERINDEQERMFGRGIGGLMRRSTTPMTGVGIPAMALVVIGVMCILVGVFATSPVE